MLVFREFPSGQHKAAVADRFDMDNDARLDLLSALSENTALRHWWKSQRNPDIH